MTSLAEKYAHVFPGNHLDELPVISSPLSLLVLPSVILERERRLVEFKHSFSDSSAFLEWVELRYLDWLQILVALQGLEPSRLSSRVFLSSVGQGLREGEALGGVATLAVDGLYLLTVIGVLKDIDPARFIWLKTGNPPRSVVPAKHRLAQAI